MSKEAYIAAHEALVAEHMEATGCTWDQAYNDPGLQDQAYNRMRDSYADRADDLRQRRKEGML